MEEDIKSLKKSKEYSTIIIKDSLEGMYAAAILTHALKNEKKSFGIQWTNKSSIKQAAPKKRVIGVGVEISTEYPGIQLNKENIIIKEIQEFAEGINPANDTTAEIVKIYEYATHQEQKGYSVIDLGEIKDMPLQKMLSITTNPFMPEITENEEAAITLCKQAQLQLRQENKIKTLLDLTTEEQTKLIKEIQKKQLGKQVTHNTTIYKEKPDQAYLVELCYQKEKRGMAIGILLEDSAAKKEALQLYIQTQKEFIKVLRQYQKSTRQEGKEAVIIPLQQVKKEEIPKLLHYLKEKECHPQKTIIILAPTIEGTTFLGYEGSKTIVEQLLEPLVVKKEQGGYELTTEQEKEFMRNAKERLALLIVEEKV